MNCIKHARFAVSGQFVPLQKALVSSRAAIQRASTAPGAVATSDRTMSIQIERVHCLTDNYSWVLHDSATKTTAVIDPSEFQPVDSFLSSKDWNLNYILNTHHHHDHTGGNLELKAKYKCMIVGPKADQQRIPGIDVALADGDVWQLAGRDVQVFDTPGHTRGHITFYIPSIDALFPGDTLFALGCGRTFEGTPEQLWNSLSKLTPLPDQTRVFCAHEYTQSNARFAVTVDPNNEQLQKRKQEIDQMREKGIATVPSLLGEEKATNPFLRPHDPAIRAKFGFSADAADWEVFGAVRKAKDNF